MRLTGQQYGALQQAITESYDPLEFEDFTRIRLGKRYSSLVTMQRRFPFQIGEVIQYFDNRRMAATLVSALMADRPDIVELQKLAYDFQVSLTAYDSSQPSRLLNRSGLEALVNGDPEFSVNEIIQGITRNKRCVCRIKVTSAEGATRYGTGFLVGQDLVLSNFHVLEWIISKPELASQVVCKFDYEEDAAGTNINQGIDFSLDAQSPIQASSPYCDFDTRGTPTVDVDWPDAHFDYALIKLSRPAGNLPFGIRATEAEEEGGEGPKRGWIKLAAVAPNLFQGSHMFILQHPDRKPLKLAIGLSKVLGCDPKKMRVRYNINTMEGSSGSPCFDQKFNWVALHNMGDPNWNPSYNQGIPAPTIIQDLQSKGVLLT